MVTSDTSNDARPQPSTLLRDCIFLSLGFLLSLTIFLDSSQEEHPNVPEEASLETPEVKCMIPSEKSSIKQTSVIAPGDSAVVQLVKPLNTPTSGEVVQAVLKVAGKIEGPDGSELDVGAAEILASAQGAKSDQRVLFRLKELHFEDSLSTKHRIAIDGWIVGEDGIRGMSGTLTEEEPSAVVQITPPREVTAIFSKPAEIPVQPSMLAFTFQAGDTVRKSQCEELRGNITKLLDGKALAITSGRSRPPTFNDRSDTKQPSLEVELHRLRKALP